MNKKFKEKKIKLPESFSGWFWDCDFSKLNPKKYKYYVIERLLEKGRMEQVKWVFDNYGRDEVKKIIEEPINLDKESVYFWKMYFQHVEKRSSN
jgi:hypothetical protein